MNNQEKNINIINNNYLKAIQILEKKGIRITAQRKILTKLIFENGNRHTSAEDIFKEINKLVYELKSLKKKKWKTFLLGSWRKCWKCFTCRK